MIHIRTEKKKHISLMYTQTLTYSRHGAWNKTNDSTSFGINEKETNKEE